MKKVYLIMSTLLIMLTSSCEEIDWENLIQITPSWDYAYSENYVDSLNAIFSSEGYVALFGGVKTQFNSEVESLDRIIYVVKANLKTGKIDEDDATLIVLDSTYMPIQISTNECVIRVSEIDNGNFSCLVKMSDEDEWIEYNGLKIEALNNIEATRTRSLATGGVSNFTISKAVGALDVANGIKGCATAKNIKTGMSEGLGVVSNFIPNDEAGLAGGLASAGLTKSLSGGLLSILSYTGNKISDGPLKYLGPVRLSIERVEQKDIQSCVVGYTVEGLHEYGMANSDLYFLLRNTKTGKYFPRLYLESKNGYENATIANLEPGEYGLVLHIRTKKYNWHYTTYPEVKFKIANLELDRYEISEEPLYKDGAVQFKLMVYLKGDNNNLKDAKEFGYYIKYANTIDYKKVKNLSTIFVATPLTYDLEIPRDGFSDETINYTLFEAEPNIDYYIGTYVVNKDGSLVHFDEEVIDGLVYKREPSFTISKITVTERGPYDDGVSGRDSYMKYTVEHILDGGLFVEGIYKKLGQNWTESGGEYLYIDTFNDKEKISCGAQVMYDSEFPDPAYISFYARLRNGSIHHFTEGLVFQNGDVGKNQSTRCVNNEQIEVIQNSKPQIILETKLQ